MKNFILFFLIIFFPLSIFSQVPNTTYVTGYVGYSNPTNQSIYFPSFSAGASIEFALTKLTAFGVDANFANLTSKEVRRGMVTLSMNSIIADNYGSNSTLGIMAFFKLQNYEAVSLPVQFFAKVGIGASHIAKTGMSYTTFERTYAKPDETSTGILFAPSLGINIPIKAKNKIVIEAQYRINKSDTQDVKSFLLNFGYGFRL